jgi:hypothetical protein
LTTGAGCSSRSRRRWTPISRRRPMGRRRRLAGRHRWAGRQVGRKSLFVGLGKSRCEQCAASAGGRPDQRSHHDAGRFRRRGDSEYPAAPWRLLVLRPDAALATHGLPCWPNHSGHRSLRRASASSTQLNATMNS